MLILKILSITAGILLGLYCVTGIGIFIALLKPSKPGKKRKYTNPEQIAREAIRDKNNAAFLEQNPEDVSIQSADGLTLRGYLLPAEKTAKRFAILVHGHRANGLNEFTHMTPFYHETLGYNVLLPDHRAHGRSEGKWIGFAALDWPNINLWIKYLTARFGDDIEIILHGISMGAATVMLVNNNNPPPQVKIVIEDCGFSSQKAELRSAAAMFLGKLEVLTVPAHYIAFALQKVICGYSYKSSDPLSGMKNAKCPMLFVHGDADKFVHTRFVYELYEACPTPKKLFVVPDAIHAFSYYKDPEGYNKAIIEFFNKHLGSAYANEPIGA